MTKDRQETKGLKCGDHVEWNTSRGTTVGVIEAKFTGPTDIEGHHVSASKDHPEFLVMSDKTGAKAAHVADVLTRITEGT